MEEKIGNVLWVICAICLPFAACMPSKSEDTLDILGEEVIKKDRGIEIDIKPIK